MSVGEISAALSAIHQRLAGAAQQTHAVADTLTAGRDRLARLFHGSSNPRVAAILGRLDVAAQHLREAASETTAGDVAIGAYAAAITASSSVSPEVPPEMGRGSVSTPGADSPDVDSATDTPVPRRPGARFDPRKADEIRPFVGNPKTVGRLYDVDGNPVAELIYSGTTGPGAGGPGLHGRWRLLESTTQHTEGHAAALVRLRHMDEAVLYLNRYPCPGEAGCFENVAQCCRVRPGSRCGSSTPMAVPYECSASGTGEALAP